MQGSRLGASDFQGTDAYENRLELLLAIINKTYADGKLTVL